MTAGEAQALCGPALQKSAYEPQRDQRALEALARWLTLRFSPTVAIEGDNALLLDITGCDRLFHGTHNLLQQVCISLHKLRLTATVAVASTPGAAWALAFAGCDRLVVPTDAPLSNVLETLPVESLRLDPEALRTLHHLGLDSIGQLMALPRTALPARFGGMLLNRLDQALGRVDEPLVGVCADEALSDGVEFDGAAPTLEPVWIVMREIFDRMTLELRRRGRGARRIEISIARPYDPPIEKTILLSRPTRDAKSIFNLVRCAIENDDVLSSLLQPAQRKDGKRFRRIRWDIDEGFTAVHIRIPVTQPLKESQISLLKHEEEAGLEEFDRLLERLHARMGDATVFQPRAIESYVPEQAYRCEEAIEQTQREEIHTSASPFIRLGHRPTYLLPRPIEVGVIVAPSDERDGRPVSFTLGNRVHRLLHASPLERIAGRWWEGRLKTRDYFEAEDAASGIRFWLFRVCETGRWFVHGVFD